MKHRKSRECTYTVFMWVVLNDNNNNNNNARVAASVMTTVCGLEKLTKFGRFVLSQLLQKEHNVR